MDMLLITTRRARSAAALLAGLALTASLAACGGDEEGDTASDPAASSSTPTPSETSSDEPTESTPTESTPPDSGSGSAGPIEASGSAGITEAVVVSATEGGGSPSTLAFALTDEQAVSDFSTDLDPGFAEVVGATVDDLARANPDATVYAAVTNIGCEAPRSVTIDAGEAGFEVRPKLPKNDIQCFAPETFVVVFPAPNA